MKKLLFSSIFLLIVVLISACHNRGEAVNTNIISTDSLQVTTTDSARAIIHGSPEQEKLDSIKKAKEEQKKQL